MTLMGWFGWGKGELTTKVIGAPAFLDALDRSDTHPLLSDTLTRFHTAPGSVLTLPVGIGPSMTLMGWFGGRMEGLTTKVIDVRDLLEANDSSDSDNHPSPSDTLTRLTLHLDQF